MLKSKILRSGLVMFLFGTFGLFSCSQNATVSSNVNPTDQTGSIEVTLPDLSNGALSKSAALLDTNSLNLLITGTNMDTIKYSWPMYSLKGQRVVINGIPAGTNRYFSGFLTNKSGTITHTGKVATTIYAATVVPLKLKLSATGGVDLCIEIEGYPSSCSNTDTIAINSCAKISGYKLLDGTIWLRSTPSYVNGYIEFTDSIPQRYTIDKLLSVSDSAGLKFCYFAGYCKEKGISAQYEMIIKGSTVSIGYIYNAATKQLIYKFYSTECTQPDTTILAGKLNAYITTTSPDTVITRDTVIGNDTTVVKYTSISQDTSIAYIYMKMYNGRAYGYLNIFSFDKGDTLHLDLFGTSNVSQDKRYGDFKVSTQDTTGCIYTLGMSFNKNGELTYCKGSLDRNGKPCSSGHVANIFGNLQYLLMPL
jgi:hypothetical protein